MTDTATTNAYCTVRSQAGGFFVNVVWYDGTGKTYGKYKYSHKRSARRAAIALAKKLDVSYRQDLEYSDTPHTFLATATV